MTHNYAAPAVLEGVVTSFNLYLPLLKLQEVMLITRLHLKLAANGTVEQEILFTLRLLDHIQVPVKLAWMVYGEIIRKMFILDQTWDCPLVLQYVTREIIPFLLNGYVEIYKYNGAQNAKIFD